jgi:hypothetical protein
MVLDAVTGQPKGILTEADIAHAAADGKDLNEVRIHELMTIRPTVINPATSVRDAARARRCAWVRTSSRGVTVQVSGGMRRNASGPPRSGLSWAAAMAAAVRGSCHPRGAGELVGGQRGPGGGERGQHGQRVGSPVLAAVGAAAGLAAVRQQRLEFWDQVGRVDVEAAGDLDEDPRRPVEQQRVRVPDQVRVDAEQVAQLPG